MIATVIATYNAEPWIEKCLDSLLNSNISNSIIVVDNASSDQTIQIISQKFPNIHLIENQNNRGFGSANNIGISYAISISEPEYIFLLNQDAWVEPNTISSLKTMMDANKDYGILSPIHVNGSGSKLDKNFENYVRYGNIGKLLMPQRTTDIIDVSFVNAAAWLISKECLRLVGGFNPNFFHYGEDNNYCQRVLKNQFKIGVLLNSYIFHGREDRAIPKKPINLTYKDFHREINLSLLNIQYPFEVNWRALIKENIVNVVLATLTLKFNNVRKNLFIIHRLLFLKKEYLKKYNAQFEKDYVFLTKYK